MKNQDAAELPKLPPRNADSHKGDYGRALLVGGSTGMSGAIGLAGLGALRSGTGLVTVATPRCCLQTVAAYEPSYMSAPVADDAEGRIAATAQQALDDLALPATAVACGPGLGRSQQLVGLVSWLYRTLPQPAVFDADALFALAADPHALDHPGGPRILTPHPGEFARLVHADCETSADYETTQQRAEAAVQRAAAWKAVVVLKGHRTLVTDGQQRYTNLTGNPGMATGGSGDVLTGVITGLLCQGLLPFAAAQLGVYLHGLAGDLAAGQLGQTSLIARDLVDYLPAAFLRHADNA